jgi:uncharacterized protein
VLAPVTRDHIARLRQDLETFRSTTPAPIVEKVAAAGFQCKRCGKCCQGRFGDNTVTIFPSEIRAIMEAAGLGWLDIAHPHESDDVDAQGFIHTFEWALRKKKNGDCAFLGDGKCAIYEHRPLICRTYPMRLEAGELELYECDGLGSGTTDRADELAEALLHRQVAEAAEALALLEKYAAYRPSRSAPAPGRTYIVHDSEGSRVVVEHSDGSFSFA